MGEVASTTSGVGSLATLLLAITSQTLFFFFLF
jgi:hypothetical protein